MNGKIKHNNWNVEIIVNALTQSFDLHNKKTFNEKWEYAYILQLLLLKTISAIGSRV